MELRRPPRRPGPAPEPGPDLAALAALAGIADLPALLAAAAAPWQADRERRLALARGRAARDGNGGAPCKLPFEAIVAAAACHHRLRMPCRLLGELLGVHESTISQAVSRINPVIQPHGIIPATAGPRINTWARLRDHAAAHGITINGITGQIPHNSGHQDDTPETADLKTDASNKLRNFHDHGRITGERTGVNGRGEQIRADFRKFPD